MNIIYETTKERGATVLIPTSMVDSMNPIVALALTGKETEPQKANGPVPLSPDTRKGSVVSPQAAGA
jgi:hypothetical protein